MTNNSTVASGVPREEWNQRPPGGWQPIETAPEFTEVLCYRPDQGVFISQLTTAEGIVPDNELENFPEDFKEWWNGEWGWQQGDERPTHWMPLPAEPNDASGVPSGSAASTTQRIDAPEAGPIPSTCDSMSKAGVWAYAHLCGYRAALNAGVRANSETSFGSCNGCTPDGLKQARIAEVRAAVFAINGIHLNDDEITAAAAVLARGDDA